MSGIRPYLAYKKAMTQIVPPLITCTTPLLEHWKQNKTLPRYTYLVSVICSQSVKDIWYIKLTFRDLIKTLRDTVYSVFGLHQHSEVLDTSLSMYP